MPESLIGWTEFGLAGLFGVFALVLTSMFLKFLKTQQETFREHLDNEREARNKNQDKLDASLKELNQTLAKMNGG